MVPKYTGKIALGVYVNFSIIIWPLYFCISFVSQIEYLYGKTQLPIALLSFYALIATLIGFLYNNSIRKNDSVRQIELIDRSIRMSYQKLLLSTLLVTVYLITINITTYIVTSPLLKEHVLWFQLLPLLVYFLMIYFLLAGFIQINRENRLIVRRTP